MIVVVVESGLASTFSLSGFDSSYHREAPFTIGLSGVDAKDIDKIESEIDRVLNDVARDGIEM
jgi:Zn-dependent M16 (insulinase) family peptidase